MPISPNSLTSTAVRASSGRRSKLFNTVVLPAPRKPVSTVTGVVSAIEFFRIDQRRGDLHQRAVTHRAIETGAAAGVAGHALLLPPQQDCIPVPTDPHILQQLHPVQHPPS